MTPVDMPAERQKSRMDSVDGDPVLEVLSQFYDGSKSDCGCENALPDSGGAADPVGDIAVDVTDTLGDALEAAGEFALNAAGEVLGHLLDGL
ncbi:MAG: hypothetical protein LBS49_00850 [Candidatus Accumulibacter sp.]|jgi:hypothetical protein|nr:hypothetical protein [Accumulibacter sp.]